VIADKTLITIHIFFREPFKGKMKQYSRCVHEILEKEKWPGSNKKVFVR